MILRKTKVQLIHRQFQIAHVLDSLFGRKMPIIRYSVWFVGESFLFFWRFAVKLLTVKSVRFYIFRLGSNWSKKLHSVSWKDPFTTDLQLEKKELKTSYSTATNACDAIGGSQNDRRYLRMTGKCGKITDESIRSLKDISCTNTVRSSMQMSKFGIQGINNWKPQRIATELWWLRF